MTVRIRLKRRGRKKLALYDIVVADVRSPRDGRFIEKLGNYDPVHKEARVKVDGERALSWLLKGAQPSDTVRNLLSNEGIMLKKHLHVGVLKQALTQEDADKKMTAWLKEREKRKAKKAAKPKKASASREEVAKVEAPVGASKPQAKEATEGTMKEKEPPEKGSATKKSVAKRETPAEVPEAQAKEVGRCQEKLSHRKAGSQKRNPDRGT